MAETGKEVCVDLDTSTKSILISSRTEGDHGRCCSRWRAFLFFFFCEVSFRFLQDVARLFTKFRGLGQHLEQDADPWPRFYLVFFLFGFLHQHVHLFRFSLRSRPRGAVFVQLWGFPEKRGMHFFFGFQKGKKKSKVKKKTKKISSFGRFQSIAIFFCFVLFFFRAVGFFFFGSLKSKKNE